MVYVIDPDVHTPFCVQVRGRGELQLGVLIENMRREGFELSVSPPTVVLQEDEQGRKLEPIGTVAIQFDCVCVGMYHADWCSCVLCAEEVTVDVDAEYIGVVIDKLCTSSVLSFAVISLGFGFLSLFSASERRDA